MVVIIYMKGDFIIARTKTKLETTKESIKSPAKINTDIKVEKIHYKEEEKRKYYCTCCGKPYSTQKGNFSISYSPLYAGNNGYVGICNSCRDSYFGTVTDFFTGNEEKSMDRICGIFDWYYEDSAVSSTRKISADRSRIGAYPSKMCLNQTKDKGTTYLDTIRDRETETIDTVADIEELKDSNSKVTQTTIKFFGLGFTENEYQWLQTQYKDWTARHECKTKAQEEIFKNLCIAQLNIQKATQSSNGKVDAAMDTFQKLLGSANIKPNQTNDNALADQNTFGTLIQKWEVEKPIPEPDPEWKDVDGILKYISTWFLGHLCKMMGVKNSYSKLYETEMAKYKVDKPQYEDDDEALFNNLFGDDNVDE